MRFSQPLVVVTISLFSALLSGAQNLSTNTSSTVSTSSSTDPITSADPTGTSTDPIPSVEPPRESSILIDPPELPELPTEAQARTAAASVGLNLTDIQGDILVGMKKNKQIFLFFNITDVKTFKKQMRTSILPLITTTTQLLTVKKQPRTAAVNVAFSATGLKALGNNDNLQDASFASGQFVNAVKLGDPNTNAWVPKLAFSNGVFLVASDNVINLNIQVARILLLLRGSVKEVYRLNGQARPGKEQGHEHFGFMDGISQPAIDGFTASPEPGQASVVPGVILVGENGDAKSASRPAWTKSGSFLAFRQLKQMVPEFNKFLNDNAIVAPGLTKQQGADLLGARMVGRWKSGAPVDLAPRKDDPKLAKDAARNNNFNFANSSGVVDDQSRCPFSAHIRKTVPRNDLPRSAVDPHRIMRAGIPYGPEVSSAEARAQKSSSSASSERGLAFVSYQSDIDSGFSFLQRIWANNVNFLPHGSDATPGFDPIIGANGGLPRNASGVYFNDLNKELTMMFDFVVSRGGEYYFSPSLSAIRNTLTV